MEFSLDRVWNPALAREPMNWAIVFVIASFWLLAFHIIMTAYAAMVAPAAQSAVGSGPGTIAILPDVTAGFTQGGLLASSGLNPDLSAFIGGPTEIFTDGIEAKYAEDGWTGNG